MATHIDAEYVGAFIGEDSRDELSGSIANLTTMITAASAMVDSALTNAGYDPTDITADDEPEIVRQATLGQCIRMLYTRNGLDVPAQYAELTGFLSSIWDGSLPIPELTPDAGDGVGGVQFSDNSVGQLEGVFVNGKMRDYY